MIKYLNETLGLNADIARWKEESALPFYLKEGREYFEVKLENKECLIIKWENESFSIPSFQKQLKQLKEYFAGTILLQFSQISSYQRKALIENKIEFIVPDKQIYAPTLGIIFQERGLVEKRKPVSMPAVAQIILLFFIYSSFGEKFSKGEISKSINISASDVTRGVEFLEINELLFSQKDGKYSKVFSNLQGKQLFEKSQSLMKSPILKKIHVKNKKEYLKFPVAGEEALSIYSNINPPFHPSRAFYGKKAASILEQDKIDPSWNNADFIEIELWKYDPACLSKNNTIDQISLYLSLKDNSDERLEIALEEMLKEGKWL